MSDLSEETKMPKDPFTEEVKPPSEDADDIIEEEFEDRQQLAVSGREELEQALEQHHAESPQLSGGDIDASWEDANAAGEETVGGTTPTPDQDVVDELGDAVGLTYQNDEPLNAEEKISQRDKKRWELDPASRQEERQPSGVREQGKQASSQKKQE